MRARLAVPLRKRVKVYEAFFVRTVLLDPYPGKAAAQGHPDEF